MLEEVNLLDPTRKLVRNARCWNAVVKFPIRALPSICSLSREDKRSNSEGIVPVNLPEDSSREVSLFNFPISDGIVPVKSCICNSKATREVSAPISVGIDPLNLHCCNFKVTKFVKSSNWCGSEPDILMFRDKSRVSKLLKSPISAGSLPSRLFEGSDNLITVPSSSHSTPNHLHFEELFIHSVLEVPPFNDKYKTWNAYLSRSLAYSSFASM
mmetsp:Transcript_11356/g.16197  ORF Transcript_11356/g.16197 Transcript_11356/m.16197 type:complete len:213 (-) Transcript_11356:2038-2676(-)